MADNAPVFDFLDDDALSIPGVKSRAHPEGKTYTIPSPDAEMGLRFSALADLGFKSSRGIEISEADRARLQFDDEREHDFSRDVLQGTYDELHADGVSWVRIQRITQYAFTYFAVGPEAANEAAQRGLFEGKARALTTGKGPRGGQSGRPGSTSSSRRRRKR